MRKIAVGFSRPNRFFPVFSWAIRLFYQTKFSHVYVRHMSKQGIDIVYQASGSNVNFMNGRIFFKKNQVVKEFEFDISDEAFDAYMRFALENVGKDYSVLQVFGIFMSEIFNLEENLFSDGQSRYVCSELVADILFEAMKFRVEKKSFDMATPKDIFELCLKAKEMVEA